ncbi:MAG: hypothetical protein N2Z21_09895 [Candidatus Sumerlaeaceae bacterium]|nr:hypothetical protein [Candidatus Sumerlaeaceae bacterium]
MKTKLKHHNAMIHWDFRARWAGSLVLLAVGAAIFLLADKPSLTFVLGRGGQIFFAVLPAAILLLLLAWAGLFILPRALVARLTISESVLFGSLVTAATASGTVLVFGVAGCLTSWLSWVLLVVAAIWAAYKARRRGLPTLASQPSYPEEPWSVAHLFLASLFALCCAPVIVSAFAPPLLYDVTEYHLGAFRDYFRDGRLVISPAPNNFYARFPFPIEALYYLGLLLEHPNDFTPKLLNLACVVGIVVLFWQWAGLWRVSRTFRLLGALALLCHPVLLEVSLDAYIDAPVALYVLAVSYGLVLLNEHGGTFTREQLIGMLNVLAWLAGSMCVAKYTVDQLYAVPLALAFALPVWRNIRQLPLRWLCVAFAFFALPLILWLGKNVVFYGNPLEPFFTRLFTPGRLSAVTWERFYIESHYPQSPLSLAYWITLLPRLESVGWLLLAPLAASALVWHKPGVPRLLLVAIASFMLWNLIRYSQDRFLLPTIVIIILVGVAALEQIPSILSRTVGGAALLLSAALGIVPHVIRVAGGDEFEYFAKFIATSPAQNLSARLTFYRKNLGALGELLDQAERSLPRDAQILLIYEARPYLLKQKTIYNTVFDDSEFLRLIRGVRTSDEITSRLLAAGVTHVLVNNEELRRFIDQYARPQQLRERGISDAMREFALIRDPEDLYPPFYLSPDWRRLRQPVIGWLRQLKSRALVVRGHPSAPIYLASLRDSK